METDDLLNRAEEEREKIFNRYDIGRDGANQIDSWEDPAFEVYHRTDKYGFIHDQRIPQKYDPYASKHFEIQKLREKKWLHMLKRWTKRDTIEKLQSRIHKGIPNPLRGEVWKRLLFVSKTMSENKGVYHHMLFLARKYCTETRQIDSDVNRQFREHIHYRERYSIKQRSLFNVLTAYSMYNMELGYCQGMSGVTGILLMYMDEEEAFWALNTLMIDPKYAMHGLFIEGFPKLQRFLAHHDNIVMKFLPKLQKHLEKHRLDSILYALKWFFVIFVERIPFSLCLRIWDMYILEGECIVTAMAFTILRLHRHKLLKMKDMDQMTEYLQCQLYKDFGYDDDHVIKIMEQSMGDLKRIKLDLPPPPLPNEFPQHKLGQFVEPNFDAKIGRRKTIFTEAERKLQANMILRQESITTDEYSSFSYDNSDESYQLSGSIRTYQSFNSLATSIAISVDGSLSGSECSIDSVKWTENTRL